MSTASAPGSPAGDQSVDGAPNSTSADPARLLEEILRQCISLGASDAHLAAGLPPYFRVHGELAARAAAGTPLEKLPASAVEGVARVLTATARRGSLPELGSVDGAVTGPDDIRFRFTAFRRQGGGSVAIRRLEDRFHNLQELGLRSDLYSQCGLADGLVVVAGPTGAGKSTTLAALIDQINQTRRCHIVTIEDPIEYVHPPQLSLVNQRQIGTDAVDFNEALVAALRQDPDVILVGEIRDLPTIRTALAAAETGHLVFTTLHAGDCVGTIERIVSVFPADEQPGVRRQLALVLRAVIAQHLVLCDGAARRTSSGSVSGPSRPRRAAVCEILQVNSGVAHLIATGRGAQIYSSIETGGQQGMQTLEADLARLWAAGQISEITALHLARNETTVRERYNALRFGSGSS
ncbi:MAG: PilT/PilU family type 4a pilus ATPase [Planctomycetaceae bacterium]|nr:MAG: PilT/PilU family type 4a pilus ATPase [Planctomycetaceae bacterium]